MPTYISLLRGINVSGQKKIKMAELRQAYSDLGFDSVKSYIQSGNVLFGTNATDQEALQQKIVNMLQERWGFDVTVWIKTPKSWQNYLTQNPFLNQEGIDHGKLHLTLLDGIPDKEKLATIQDGNYKDDRFLAVDEAIYVYCPNGYGRSKLTNTFFERKLNCSATTRNWRSVNKILDLATAL